MEKLTWEVLGPYLAHKIKIMCFKVPKVMNAGSGSSNYWIGIGSVIKWQSPYRINKPILRPISSLTDEEVRKHFKGSVEVDYVLGYKNLGVYKAEELPYYIFDKLLSLHIDLFNLIDRELAIDSTKLTEYYENNKNQ